jgi:hypothetical protein
MSYYAGEVINRNFLSFRTTIYENKELTVEKSGGYFGKNIASPSTEYYLLEFGLGKSLVKQVEKTNKINVPKTCEVRFVKHLIIYDVCEEKFYP